jgi:hypothetical protein
LRRIGDGLGDRPSGVDVLNNSTDLNRTSSAETILESLDTSTADDGDALFSEISGQIRERFRLGVGINSLCLLLTLGLT